MNRRNFLRNLACGIGGGVLLNNAVINGSVFGKKTLSKIGLQLYTVRSNMEKDFEGTLRQVAALGIKEVEFAGYFGRKPEQVKKLLTELKLDAPSAHFSSVVGRDELPKAIEDAKIIGHKYLVFAYLREEERRSLDDYKKLVDKLNKAGEECHKAGIQFAYHNHDFEFIKWDGQLPYDLILSQTDANLVKMEMDLYWITKAGYDPVSYFEKHSGRFPLVHVKDMDNTPKKYFTEVGHGTIDFKRIFSNADKGGIKHYFIEQDETPADPLESVKVSVKYLRDLKF